MVLFSVSWDDEPNLTEMLSELEYDGSWATAGQPLNTTQHPDGTLRNSLFGFLFLP